MEMQIVAIGIINQKNELVYGCPNCDHEEVRKQQVPSKECGGAQKIVNSEQWTLANGKPPGTSGDWWKRSLKCQQCDYERTHIVPRRGKK